jgi:hypothetical protein
MRNHYSLWLLLMMLMMSCRSERAAFTFHSPRLARPLPEPAQVQAPMAAAAPRVPTPLLAAHSSLGPLHRLSSKRSVARKPAASPLGLSLRRTGLGHSETTQRASPYGKARRQHFRPARNYVPLVMAAILVALGALLLIGAAATFTSSFIPLIGVLIILLGGVVYFHWRYEQPT